MAKSASAQGYAPLATTESHDFDCPDARHTGSGQAFRRPYTDSRGDGDGDSEDDDALAPYHLDRHGDSPSPQPLIKNGVHGSLAWHRMRPRQKAAVFAVFGLLGGGMLLPFNAIITPAEYFRSSFASTQYATTFSSWIVVSYNVVSILFGLHATATGGFERSSPRRRIIASSLAIMLALVCFIISTMVNLYSDAATVHTNPTAYFYLVIALGSLLSAATAYMQNAVVALSTAFGAGGRFMGIMLTGQGLVGLGISLVGIVSAWSQSSAEDRSLSPPLLDSPIGPLNPAEQEANEIARAATVFFTMSLAFMAVVVAAFVWLGRSELYAQVMAKEVASIQRVDTDPPSDALDSADLAEHGMTQSFHSERSVSHPHYASMLKSFPGFHRLSAETRSSLLRLAAVQSKAAWDCFAVAFIFTVTLSLFPALTSAVQSVYSPTSIEGGGGRPHRHVALDLTSPQIFVPFHFFLYNLSDLAGRTLPSVAPQTLLRKTRALVGASLARVVFVPVFLACHVVSGSRRTGPISSDEGGRGGGGDAAPPLGPLQSLMQSSDAPFFIAMLLFGLTNGFVSTCIMISGPSRSSLRNSKGSSEAPLAAALLSFWLCVGLAVGSGLSFWTVPQ
ncbi:uncharacterized protein PFL1_06197 [Pseudozyma flocculosa PF-1]|nr:uncharacterized protein PFL1_06197 [Pseudozyma flocculosa PF-1]EPQ26262.1 hypothetical protein PFL1_06197 [Pseudozyma flocculosa PF-1]